MKTLKFIYFMSLLLGVMLLIAPAEGTQPQPGKKAPVITNSYAVDKGRYGTIWKIYIEAEATDAEMAKIAAVVDQPGQGRYPTDFILLKPSYRNQLKGYLQWNTFSSTGIASKEGDQIILRISVIDKVGNESREVVFPFTVVSGVKDQSKPPAPFDQGGIPRLGYISIDLKSPGMRY